VITATERLLRQERLTVLAGIAAITLLCWWYLVSGAGTGMSVGAMTTWRFPPPLHGSQGEPWSPSYGVIMLLMWWSMMIAMMLPSAAPVILLYARVQRHHRGAANERGLGLCVGSFLFGYLWAWLLFSALATLLQWGLESSGLLHHMLMWSNSRMLSVGFLIAAGVYQFTHLKQACLRHCRHPAVYLSRGWRRGPAGALRMGFGHGLFCVACCWPMMLLLFVGGVMNLVWIAGLAILVLLEKLAPRGDRLARFTGAAMLLAALYLLLRQ
jgi:predicted metal-binding membrane protein